METTAKNKILATWLILGLAIIGLIFTYSAASAKNDYQSTETPTTSGTPGTPSGTVTETPSGTQTPVPTTSPTPQWFVIRDIYQDFEAEFSGEEEFNESLHTVSYDNECGYQAENTGLTFYSTFGAERWSWNGWVDVGFWETITPNDAWDSFARFTDPATSGETWVCAHVGDTAGGTIEDYPEWYSCEEIMTESGITEWQDRKHYLGVDKGGIRWWKPINFAVNVTQFYWLCYGTPPEDDCWNSYEISTKITTDAVDSFNVVPPTVLSEGVLGKSLPITASGYYALEVIEPPWQAYAHPPVNSFDGQLSPTWLTGIGGAQWYDFEDYPGACVQPIDEYGRKMVYFYVDGSSPIEAYLTGVRVDDPNENWTLNEGALNYNLYHAIYHAEDGACEGNYEVVAPVSTNSIPSWYEDGGFLFTTSSPQPEATYLLEIAGDPWFDGNNPLPQHSFDISYDGGLTWLDIGLVNADCYTSPGANVIKFYFTAQSNQTYKLRAGDDPGDFMDNSGYVNFTVSLVEDYRETVCSNNFTLGSSTTHSVAANSQVGSLVGGKELTIDNWYALEITDPAWYDNGVMAYGAELTGEHYQIPTWWNLGDYPGVACQENVGNYKRIYFKAQYGQYIIRADDGDENFPNNSGSLTYKLYDVTASEQNPPGSCEDAYNQARVLISQFELYANLANGIKLSLEPGTYVIEAEQGPWLNESTPSYAFALTDGGIAGDYVPVGPEGVATPIECAISLSDGKHYRAYFSVYQGNEYRVRVYDPGDTYTTNTGSMWMSVYKVTSSEEAPPEYGENPIVTGCDSICIRPDSILEVSEWIEYSNCTFSKFISFCPYHAEALASLVLEFDQYEPFSTVMAFTTIPDQIREEFGAYAWATDQGGQGDNVELSSQPWDILAVLPSNSPYNGGQITLLKAGPAFSTFCTTEMNKTVGSRLGGPMCFSMNVLNAIGGVAWMQFVFDLALILSFGLYIYNLWIKNLA